MATRRRYGISALLLSAFCALALVAAACEEDNAIVAQKQLQEALQGCPKGCEESQPNCQIKGNISAMGNKFYHWPGAKNYDGVVIQPEKGERWFCTETEAVNNGWKRSAE